MYGDFYIGKRILITGVAGVKGSWLAEGLLRAGAKVIGVDRRVPGPDSSYSAAGLGKRIEFVHGDVAAPELMASLLDGIDGVFHLAALAIVGEARRNPFETYRSNSLGTASVLEGLRQAKRPAYAVFVTTDKVYRPKGGDPWVETDPLMATGPYAVSKACAEFIIADYCRTYFTDSRIRIGIGRAGNVLVGGDFHSSTNTHGGGRIFVDCYEALAEGRIPEIYSPGFTRPYTYGLDIVSGYMTLMSRLDCEGVAGEAFNFGPCEQYGVPNSLLATKIAEVWGSEGGWRTGKRREEPFEFQSLSTRKSQELLDWRPAYTLYEAIRDTTEWYRAWNARRASPTEGCMQDVNERLYEAYESSARRYGVWWASIGAPPASADSPSST